MRTVVIAAIIVMATLVLIGCGEAGVDRGVAEADKAQMTAALEALVTPRDPKDRCRALTRGLIRLVFDAPGDCLRRAASLAPARISKGALKVTDVKITGDRASAELQSTDGKLTLVFERERGRWRIDDLGPELTHFIAAQSITELGLFRQPPFSTPAVVRCGQRRVTELSPRRTRQMVFTGRERGFANRVIAIVSPCLVSEREGRAAARKVFENSIRGNRDLDAARSNCIIRRLRQTLSSRFLAENFTKESKRVTDLVTRAASECS